MACINKIFLIIFLILLLFFFICQRSCLHIYIMSFYRLMLVLMLLLIQFIKVLFIVVILELDLIIKLHFYNYFIALRKYNS